MKNILSGQTMDTATCAGGQNISLLLHSPTTHFICFLFLKKKKKFFMWIKKISGVLGRLFFSMAQSFEGSGSHVCPSSSTFWAEKVLKRGKQSSLCLLVHSVSVSVGVCMCVCSPGGQVELTPVSNVIKVREQALLLGAQHSGFPGRG